MGKQIEYSNGELTIVWQPELCRHAGICVKTLPNVYHPQERPWINRRKHLSNDIPGDFYISSPSTNCGYKI